MTTAKDRAHHHLAATAPRPGPVPCHWRTGGPYSLADDNLSADRGADAPYRLVAEARHSNRPITISENGKPVAALINIDDLADLEDRAALAAHLADKAAGPHGISLDELDTALDRIDAATLS